MSEKIFHNVVVDDDVFTRLKKLKYNTGGRSYTRLILQMIDISERKILEQAREEALIINNTQR